MAGLMTTRSGAAKLEWQRFGYGAAVSLLVVILLTELLLYARVRVQRRKELPPGPRPWPIFGNFPALAGAMPHLSLQRSAAKFGPLMYLRLVQDHGLCSESWKAVAESAKVQRQRDFLCKACRIVRRHPTRLARQHDAGASGGVKQRLYYGNGAKFRYEEDVKEEFDQCLQDRKRCILAPIISDYVPWLRFFSETVQGWRPKLESCADRQMALGVKMLELEKRRQRAAKSKDDDDSYVLDFVDVMLGAPMDDGKVLEDEFLIKQVMEFFSAGTETSSTTVEWALAELVAQPELMNRAQEEIDGVVGIDRLVQESDVPKLPFLQAIVKESFRMHPASPLGVPRESTSPAEALGYKIPAGTRIIYNVYAVHRDPTVYENPNVFDPDRFLRHHMQVNHLSAFDSYVLISFGVGRRMCPGYNLANTVVHFMLANLILSYDWAVPMAEVLI